MKTQVMEQPAIFNVRQYFKTLTRMLYEPRLFYSEMPRDGSWKKAFSFLMISSLFYTGASIGSMTPSVVVMGIIHFINAVGMTLFAAIIGFIVITMPFGKPAPFGTFFSIYAYAAGVTLLSSWMPFFLILTEPWKWWLTYLGLKNVCHLKTLKCVLVIVVSIVLQVLVFLSLLPIIKG